MSDFFCNNCGFTDIDEHGRCVKCQSERVAVQPKSFAFNDLSESKKSKILVDNVS